MATCPGRRAQFTQEIAAASAVKREQQKRARIQDSRELPRPSENRATQDFSAALPQWDLVDAVNAKVFSEEMKETKRMSKKS